MRLATAACLALGFVAALPAQASPWVLGPDDLSVYTAVDHYRWSSYAGATGKSYPIGQPVTRTTGAADISYGLVEGVQVGGKIGYAVSQVGRWDADRCLALGDDACKAVQGVIPLELNLKGRLVDELGSSPLTMAVVLGGRLAEWTASDRHRLTALGEGQTDIYGGLAMGRAGTGYAVWSQVLYAYRLPVATVNYLDGIKVPGDEIRAAVDVHVYPTSSIGLGPSVDFLHRLTGVDWSDVQNQDIDRYTALQVTTLKLGGKLSIRSQKNATIWLSGFGTLVARNNPIDGMNLSVGLGLFRPSGGQQGS